MLDQGWKLDYSGRNVHWKGDCHATQGRVLDMVFAEKDWTMKVRESSSDHSQHIAQIGSPLGQVFAVLATRVYAKWLLDIQQRAFKACENNKSASVLDLGTGDSHFLHYLNWKICSKKLHAIDLISNGDIGVQTFIGNIEQGIPRPDASYDVVISSFNIEHIIDIPLYLQEIGRVMTPKGYAIILTENLASWLNIFALVCGYQPFSLTSGFGKPFGNPLCWHSEIYDDALNAGAYEQKLWGVLGHVRVLTPLGYTELFDRAGLRVESTLGSRHSHFVGWKLRRIT